MSFFKFSVSAALAFAVGSFGLVANAQAEKLAVHPGMTGVADMGIVPCEVLTNMYVRGELGVRQASLFWAGGYVYAKTGKVLDDVIAQSPVPGSGTWNWDSVTDVIKDFCEKNPEAGLPAASEHLMAVLAGGEKANSASE